MGVLEDQGVGYVHHYTPLHYLPFIARSGALLGKPSLAAAGFSENHLRSMSSIHDVRRGFGSYAFLTLDPTPRILGAKLRAGFPHIGIAVPASTIDSLENSLCRFNVAMTRQLRRGNRPGHAESASNGRYYDQQEMPVARENADKTALLEAHLDKNMIEVLVHGDVPLPFDTKVISFAKEDEQIAQKVLARLEVPWTVELVPPPGPYNRRDDYVTAVEAFVAEALADASWRGNGLEFDRV